MTELPEGYVRTLKALLSKMVDWKMGHDVSTLFFWLPPARVELGMGLDQGATFLAGNPATAAFIGWLDDATDRQGTSIMLCHLVRSLGFPFKEWDSEMLAAVMAKAAPLSRGGQS